MKKIIILFVLLSLACSSSATLVRRTLCGNVNIRDNPSMRGRSYGNKLIGETV